MDHLIGRLLSSIHEEQREGNLVWVNISSGTNLFAAAAIVACMYMGATPYYCEAEYRIGEEVYYEDGKLAGITSGAGPPEALPIFRLELPASQEIRILQLFADAGGQLRPRDLAQLLFIEGILEPTSRLYRNLEVDKSQWLSHSQRKKLVEEGTKQYGPVVPGALATTRKKLESMMEREPPLVTTRGSTRNQRYILNEAGKKRLEIFAKVISWTPP